MKLTILTGELDGVPQRGRRRHALISAFEEAKFPAVIETFEYYVASNFFEPDKTNRLCCASRAAATL